MKKNDKYKLKKDTFMQGAIISSIFFIIIKILGALYVIPFYKIIGEEGGTLYSYAYNIYNLFLNISTAGIPIAMSMIISEYIALDMHDAKERAKKVGTISTLILATISFVVVFFGAPYFAEFLLSDASGGHSVDSVGLVIRMTAFCLIIIPFLSVLRGYLQGHKFITATSFSQVLEQIIRIVVVLAGSYIAIKVLGEAVDVGVAVALTGAFFGGLVAFIYLKCKMRGAKEEFQKPTKKDDVSNKIILKKIFSYCVPIVLIAIIDNIYTLIDIKLIVKGLSKVGYAALSSQTISGIVATWAPKICTIIIAISLSLTTNIIPHITDSYTKKDFKGVNKSINQALSTMIIITVPMSLLLMMLSRESYYVFYQNSEYGPLILSFSAISHLFFGIWTVLNSVLQSLRKFKIIYINSIVGLAVNALLDIPIILLLNRYGFPEYVGTVIATCIGYLISIIIVVFYLRKEMNFRLNDTRKIIKKIIYPVAIVFIVLFILTHIVTYEYTLLSALLSLFINGIIGLSIYLFLTYKNGALYDVFGKESIDKILRKIKLKK